MGVTARTTARAQLRARAIRQELGQELREARLTQARSLTHVATAAGISRSQLSRVELGTAPTVSIAVLTMVCAALGLDFAARIYPGRRGLRDGPQIQLIRGFRERLGPDWMWAFEVAVASGDQRAWDARATHRVTGVTFVLQAEPHLRDAQALLRRIHLEQEMGGQPRVMLLVAATRHNRQALIEAGPYIREALPIGTRAALHGLSRGVDPGPTAS